MEESGHGDQEEMKFESSEVITGQIPATSNWLGIHIMEYGLALKQNEATFLMTFKVY